MRKLFFLCLLMMSFASYSITVNVNVKAPGTLRSILSISEDYLCSIESLIVSGKLNTDDYKFIQEITVSQDYGIIPYNLLLLDLSNTSIDGDSLSYNELGNGAVSNIRILLLPKSLKKICDKTYAYSSRLQKITMYDSLQYIGTHFCAWARTDTVRIPKSVKFYGHQAFSGCVNTYYFNCTNPPVYIDHCANGDEQGGAIGSMGADLLDYWRDTYIHVLSGSKTAFRNSYPWGRFRYITEDVTTDIRTIDIQTNEKPEIYTIDGIKVDQVRRGIYILKYRSYTRKIHVQ